MSFTLQSQKSDLHSIDKDSVLIERTYEAYEKRDTISLKKKY